MQAGTILASLFVLPLAALVVRPAVEQDASDSARAEVEATLDAFHDSAAKADADAHLALLAEDAVLVGTDAGERWSVDEYRRLIVEPLFAKGGRLTVADATHVTVDEGGQLAWFVQELESERWGAMRGSGVARRGGEGWEIVQYVWSFSVPNELVPGLMELKRGK